MTGRRKEWIQQVHDSELLRLWQEHKNLTLCAQLMGFSSFAVWTHAQRLGIGEPRKLPKEHPTGPARERQNPIAVAFDALGDRLKERPTGFWLDGSPSNLTAIMRETNRVRAAAGMEQLTVNPAWVVNV